MTGAGSGIGRSTAALFARLGAKAHAVDIDGDAARRVSDEIASAGGSAVAHTVDCSDPAALDALAARIFADDGAVDVLHNNAGIGHAADVEDTTADDWQRVISINLLGVAYGVQAFVPRMLRQGRPAHVVNTASVLGLLAVAGMAPYSASKFGVVGLTEALNAELAPRGISVSAICPGIIDTAITRTAIMHGEREARRDAAIEFYARRGASPDQVAEAVVDAVVRRKLIQPVPKLQVMPGWLLKRISPRAGQLLSRALPKLVGGG